MGDIETIYRVGEREFRTLKGAEKFNGMADDIGYMCSWFKKDFSNIGQFETWSPEEIEEFLGTLLFEYEEYINRVKLSGAAK